MSDGLLGGRAKLDENNTKLLLDYAWKWFDFYARQRTTMFNFYIILSSLILNAYFVAHKDAQGAVLASGVCVLGIVSSVLFVLIDYRNRQLIDSGEQMLLALEERGCFSEEFPIKVNGRFIGLMRKEKEERGGTIERGWLRHKYLLPAVYGAFFLTFALLLGIERASL